MKSVVAALAAAITIGSAAAVSAQTTNDERPGAPQPLQITGQADGVIDLQWRRSTDDTGIAFYRLFDRGELVFEWENALVDDDPTNPFIPTTVPMQFAHGAHWFQMQAVDLGGNESVKTSPVRVVVDRVGPSAPVELAAEVSYISATTRVIVRFALPDPDDIATCTLLRNLSPTGARAVEPERDGEDPSRFVIVDFGADPGNAWYQVQCVDAAGNQSVRSAPVFVPDIIDFG